MIKGELSRLGWILVASAEPPLINIPLDAATDDTVIEAFLAGLEIVVRRAQTGDSGSREDLQY